jgi:hypothetical protein
MRHLVVAALALLQVSLALAGVANPNRTPSTFEGQPMGLVRRLDALAIDAWYAPGFFPVAGNAPASAAATVGAS